MNRFCCFITLTRYFHKIIFPVSLAPQPHSTSPPHRNPILHLLRLSLQGLKIPERRKHRIRRFVQHLRNLQSTRCELVTPKRLHQTRRPLHHTTTRSQPPPCCISIIHQLYHLLLTVRQIRTLSAQNPRLYCWERPLALSLVRIHPFNMTTVVVV